MYADKGIKDSGNESFSPVSYDINPVLDELGVGLGAAYSINENINIGITYSYTWFMEGEAFDGAEKLNKSRHIIGIQVGYKM
jgi:long-subunit fatty acid transport protein